MQFKVDGKVFLELKTKLLKQTDMAKKTDEMTLKTLQVQQVQLLKLKPHSHLECIKSPTGNLAVMEQKGFDILAFVTLHISNVNLAFNFENIMTVPQIKNCAETLIDKYWTFTPEDFSMCCQQMKELKLIKNFYNSIDESKFYQAFHLYDQEREREIERMLEIERIQKETEFSNVFNQTLASAPTEFIDKLQALADSLLERKKNMIKIEPAKQRIKTPVEKLFQDLMKEFDKLVDSQWTGKQKPAIAWIDYNNQKMDVEKYCNERFNEMNLIKIKELMPNITWNTIFKANGKRFICISAFGWNGTDECIFYHEINQSGNQIGPQKTRSHVDIRKDIRSGTITF